jgi:MFS family permease
LFHNSMGTMRRMKFGQIQKLYLSNLLTGIVFWYSIEKLFMRNIGISAIGIGGATAALTIFLVLFDIPGGILADKWSRKGTLFVSSISLALASLLGGLSHSLTGYILAELFYGLYVVTTSGVYQAVIYDSLRELDLQEKYSKINGRIYACFMLGAAGGDIASGFLAHKFGYRDAYFLTIIPCLLNSLVILTLHEPKLHDVINKEKVIHEARKATVAILKNPLIKSLVIVFTLIGLIEFFKLEFGQLYMFRYVSSARSIGILWALFALAMSTGSLIAHHFRSKLNTLLVFSVLPLLCMSIFDNRVSLILFMIQAVASAALINQIETRIQDSTPSRVRASVLSVVSTFGRFIAVPFSFVLGWIFQNYSQLIAIRFVTIIGLLALTFWIISVICLPSVDDAIIIK